MKFNKKIIWTAIIVVLAIVLIFALGNKNNVSGPIKVGVITGLSGQYASIGEAVKNGINLSLKNDPNVTLVFEDSQFQPVPGLNAYKKLSSIDKVDIIIGADSFAFPSIVPLVHESGMPYLQLFESSAHEKDSVFQVMPFSYPLFTALGKAASERFQKVALVYSGDSDLFLTNADYFKKGVNPSSLVYETKIGNNSDYRTEALKLIKSGANAYTIMMPLDSGIKFIKAVDEQKGTKSINAICDSNVELAIDQYIKGVGSKTMQGCISTSLPSNSSDEFVKAYKKEYGVDPIFGANWGYDAGEIVKKIENQPRGKWLDVIQNLKFTGASGNIAFDETGTRFAESVVKELVGNKFIEVGSSTKITN